MTITEKQRAVLAFIVTFRKAYGYSPTSAEIAKRFEFSPQAGRQHVTALEKAGKIKTTPRVSRSIIVL